MPERIVGIHFQIVRFYYLFTPLFIYLDYVEEISIRVSFLNEHPRAKLAYYLTCCVFGLLMSLKKGALTPVIALVECSVSIMMLCISVQLQALELGLKIYDGEIVSNPFTTAFFINFFLCSVILVLSFLNNPLVRRAKNLRKH